MDDTIDILERFPAIHLRARDHVDAVTAVRRQGWTWPVGRPHRRDGEEKSSEGQNDKHEDEEKDPEGAHIRRGLPSVLTLSGGRYEEGPARAVGGACAAGVGAAGVPAPPPPAPPQAASPMPPTSRAHNSPCRT